MQFHFKCKSITFFGHLKIFKLVILFHSIDKDIGAYIVIIHPDVKCIKISIRDCYIKPIRECLYVIPYGLEIKGIHIEYNLM